MADRNKQTIHRLINVVWRQERQNKMKSISAILCAVALLGSMGIASAETCCEKAKAAGKECEHKCCVKAKKEGKVCEKCNPPKK